MAEQSKDTACVQETQSAMPQLPTTRKPGGLYRNVKMSVKTANILVLIGAAALLFTIFFLANHNGFTVKFDTNGGSQIEACKVLHGETVPAPPAPVKEGYVFTGWYVDKDCTVIWDMDTDTVTESFTLFAGWAEKETAP